MIEKMMLKGRGLTEGIAKGVAVATKQPFNFLAAYSHLQRGRPSSIVGDVKHELFRKDIGGKVLVIPHCVGSLASGVALLEAIKQGVAPNAIASAEIEPAVLSGAVFADLFFGLPLPIVDRLDRNALKSINTGDHVKVDAYNGIVEVEKGE